MMFPSILPFLRKYMPIIATIGVVFTIIAAIPVCTHLFRATEKPPTKTEAYQQSTQKSEEPLQKRVSHKKSPPSSTQQIPDKPKSVAAAAFVVQSSSTKPQSQQNPPTPSTSRVPKRIIGKKVTVSIGGEPPKDDPDEVVGESIKVHVPDSEIGKHQKVIGEEVNVTVGSPKK